MQERFKQLLEEKGLTATRFAAIIKVNASAMSHILNGRSKPGFDVLDKIAQAFPDVNLNWLVSGNGAIYNNTGKVEQVVVKPVQKLLFEEEKKEERLDEKKPVTSATDIASVIAEMPVSKKLKRIVLFFDDGSFEDYAK